MSHPNQHIIDAISAGKKVYWKFTRKSEVMNSGFFNAGTDGTVWFALLHSDIEYHFTVMPDMVKIGNIEVVAPLKEAKADQIVFIAESDGTVVDFHSSKENDYMPFIINRTAFATREAALAYRNAIKILLK